MKKGKVASWMGRGFTLVELMVVVMIVGVLAAIIIPTASSAMRARRGSGTASHIALAYRMGKMRAMGRGNAVLVRYSAGKVETFEAVTGNTPGALVPAASCVSPANRWDVCVANSPSCIPIDSYKDSGESLNYKLVGGSNVTITETFDICFTPAGQSYYRTGTNGFAPMVDLVPQLQIWVGDASSTAASVVHTVYVLPNGAARVVARQGT